jgi:hypothetical protein
VLSSDLTHRLPKKLSGQKVPAQGFGSARVFYFLKDSLREQVSGSRPGAYQDEWDEKRE